MVVWTDRYGNRRPLRSHLAKPVKCWCGRDKYESSLDAWLAAKVLDQVDIPAVRRWHDTTTVSVYCATSPGWDTLADLIAETIPLDELEAHLTRLNLLGE